MTRDFLFIHIELFLRKEADVMRKFLINNTKKKTDEDQTKLQSKNIGSNSETYFLFLT